MIIYNVTIKVNSSIEDEWLRWLKELHIPDILNTGCFNSVRIFRLLEVGDTDGPTYAIQFSAESKALYNQYTEQFSGIMLQKVFDQWGDQFIAFRSVMQLVN